MTPARPTLLFLLFILSFILSITASVAYAGVTVDTTLKKVSAVYNTTVSYQSTASIVPRQTFSSSVQVQYNLLQATENQGNSLASNTGVGWGGLVIFHDNETNTTQEIRLGPGISDGYIVKTQTVTETKIYTTTYTTTVVTTVISGTTYTQTVPAGPTSVGIDEGGKRLTAALAAAGLLAIILGALLARGGR